MAPGERTKELRHVGKAVPLALALMLVMGAVAFADDLKVDLTSAPTDTSITVGASTTATYFLTAQRDSGEPTTGQPVCNASSANPLEVTIVSSPATGLTISPNPAQLTGCGGSSGVLVTFTGDAAGTYNLTATTGGGNGNAVDVTKAVWTLTVEDDSSPPADTTPPDVSISLDPTSPNGNNDWYIGNVKVTVSASDDSGISAVEYNLNSAGWMAYSGPITVSTDDYYSIEARATDNSTNQNVGTAGPISFKIDRTKPTSVVSFTDGATFYLGELLPTPSCISDDNLSGIATPGTLSGPTGSGPGNPNGVGSFTYTCDGAIDEAGNEQAVEDNRTFTVLYDLSATKILQPINPDNSSLFSRGKAVPVKFQLPGTNPYVMTGWKLLQQQVACSLGGVTIGDSVEAVAENPSNSFRYDATAGQYIYNANFKDKAAGTCWKAGVQLDSGQTFWSAIFKLQK